MSDQAAVPGWHGLYAGTWNGDIVPAAYAHPAKFSRLLIARIYQHALAAGYLRPGDSVIDPFGGVALGALDAITNGIHWTGVELEANFVDLGQKNITLWNERYGRYNAEKGKPFGTARLIQGDSRNLAALVGMKVEMCVSSPPYAEGLGHDTGHPRLDAKEDARRAAEGCGRRSGYGYSPGQLGAMKDTGYAAAISSPPYADAVNGSGEGPGARHDPIYHNGDNAYKASNGNAYGRTPGNLGNMGGNGYDAAISSPPFEQSNAVQGGMQRNGGLQLSEPGDRFAVSPGNIGNDRGNDFWTAARLIAEQVYTVLRPGGHAIWVTGDFVRDGRRVYFGRQWQELCTAAGFVPVEWIVAHKSESKGVQLDIFGNAISQSVDRVSFFRRLANEKNPDAAILNEDVIIMRKSL